MNINTQKLTVQWSQTNEYNNDTREYEEKDSGFIRISVSSPDIKRTNYKGIEEEYDYSFTISLHEIPHVIDCLMGTAHFYPWFDDGIYNVRFTPHGIRGRYLSGGKTYEEYYYIFPGSEFAKALTQIEDWELSSDILEYWQAKYSSRYKWECRDITDYDTVTGEFVTRYKLQDLIDRDLQDTRQTRLKDCLQGLEQIALNYSDGIPSIINISLDSYRQEIEKGNPLSYYWYITQEGNRVMNGGIIAHERVSDDMLSQRWEYSTHT